MQLLLRRIYIIAVALVAWAVSGDVIRFLAVLVAATALALKITQPKVTLPRAALSASAQPVDPAILHGALQKLQSEGALP